MGLWASQFQGLRQFRFTTAQTHLQPYTLYIYSLPDSMRDPAVVSEPF